MDHGQRRARAGTPRRHGWGRTPVVTTLVVLFVVALAGAAVLVGGLPWRDPGDTGGAAGATASAGAGDTPCLPTVGSFTAEGRESPWLRYACGLPSRPRGIVVHLHGDGAGELDDPEGSLGELAAAANSRGLLFLAPRSPDGDDGTTWWRDPGGNLAWLRAFISDPTVTGGADTTHLY